MLERPSTAVRDGGLVVIEFSSWRRPEPGANADLIAFRHPRFGGELPGGRPHGMVTLSNIT